MQHFAQFLTRINHTLTYITYIITIVRTCGSVSRIRLCMLVAKYSESKLRLSSRLGDIWRLWSVCWVTTVARAGEDSLESLPSVCLARLQCLSDQSAQEI